MSYFIPPRKSNIIFLSWNFTGYNNNIPWQALKELDVRLLAITDYEKEKTLYNDKSVRIKSIVGNNMYNSTPIN